MSAYQVSDDCIKMLAVNSKSKHSSMTVEEMTKTAKMLWDANAASLGALYDGRHPSEGEAPVVTEQDVRRFDSYEPLTVIKSAQCFAYQACEVGDWNTTPAHEMVESIIAIAIHRLPGYYDAPWGI